LAHALAPARTRPPRAGPRAQWALPGQPRNARLRAPALAEALWQWRRQTRYQGEGGRVFCSQQTGGKYRAEVFTEAFRAALAAAGVEGHIRPFHDLRHTAITNDAASGASPIAVMAKAGHADMGTTKRYMHLAGVVFRSEAEALERRLLGAGASAERGDVA
jgi:integrase